MALGQARMAVAVATQEVLEAVKAGVMEKVEVQPLPPPSKSASPGTIHQRRTTI